MAVGLAWVPPASAASTPAFVQARANEVGSGTTNSLAFTTPNTAGNLIVVYAIWSNAGTATVTDSRGNAFVSAAPRTTWGTNWSSQVFVAKNIAGGANTVTATFATAINACAVIYIHEYSGLDKANPVDVTKSATGSASAMSSGAVTTTNATDLIFAGGASKGAVTQGGSGYTTRSTAFGNRTEDRNVTTAGSYTATATQNSNAWVMQLVALRADPGAPDTIPPSAPTGLTATAVSGTQVNLSWTASTDNVGVTGYKVFRNGTQIATPTATTFNDTGLTASTTYSYTVSAVDAAGNTSTPSGAVSATTAAADTQSAVPADRSGRHRRVEHPDQPGVDGVDRQRGCHGLSRVPQRDARSPPPPPRRSTTPVSPPGRPTATASRRWMRPATSRVPSATVSATTPAAADTTPPSQPAGLTATAVSGSTDQPGWTASTDNVGVTGYKVFRNGTQIATPTATTFNDTGLTASTTYSYTVAAVDAAGNTSTPSTAVSATTTGTADTTPPTITITAPAAGATRDGHRHRHGDGVRQRRCGRACSSSSTTPPSVSRTPLRRSATHGTRGARPTAPTRSRRSPGTRRATARRRPRST